MKEISCSPFFEVGDFGSHLALLLIILHSAQGPFLLLLEGTYVVPGI